MVDGGTWNAALVVLGCTILGKMVSQSQQNPCERSGAYRYRRESDIVTVLHITTWIIARGDLIDTRCFIEQLLGIRMLTSLTPGRDTAEVL